MIFVTRSSAQIRENARFTPVPSILILACLNMTGSIICRRRLFSWRNFDLKLSAKISAACWLEE